jgi:hypothetical protein
VMPGRHQDLPLHGQPMPLPTRIPCPRTGIRRRAAKEICGR